MKAVRQEKTSSKRPISVKEYLEMKEDITYSVVDKIDALRNEMNTRFEGVDTKFDGMNTKFESMNTKFESIEKRLNLITVLFSVFLSLITVLITVFKFIQ